MIAIIGLGVGVLVLVAGVVLAVVRSRGRK
jgi:hypothetical protein